MGKVIPDRAGVSSNSVIVQYLTHFSLVISSMNVNATTSRDAKLHSGPNYTTNTHLAYKYCKVVFYAFAAMLMHH